MLTYSYFNFSGQLSCLQPPANSAATGKICSAGGSVNMIFSMPRQPFNLIIEISFESITLFSIPANILQPAASSFKPCLRHLPCAKPCPKSCTGEMIFYNLCSSFLSSLLETHHLYFFLLQPMSSNQQPAPSRSALKRKSDNEV